MSQIAALISSFVLRKYLHHNKVSATARHLFSAIVGIVLVYFCHGRHVFHIFAFPIISYIILVLTSPQIFQRLILVIALGYLSFVHLMRQIYSYGSYVLDITGPMMLITQKVTSLAFSLHDGLTKDDKSLTTDQKRYAIRRFPSPVEFFSFIYGFHVLMCGPVIFYTDYRDFIEGKHFLRATSDTNGLNDVYENSKEPSAASAVFKKTAASILFAVMLLNVTPIFFISWITESEFLLNTPFYKKILYILISTSCVRFKYYHAWTLADAVCNASGLGFNGYNKDGTPRWDAFSNVNVLKFESAPSFKETLENWNKSTMVWLRQVAYNRAPFQKTLLTYCLSAIWHGFYPGYYVTFFGGALSTLAARSVRRSVRPLFQKTEFWKRAYDVMTTVVTRLLISYLVFPFVILEFWSSIQVYKHLYFYGHIIMGFCIFILPYVLPPPPRSKLTITEKKSEHVSVGASQQIPGLQEALLESKNSILTSEISLEPRRHRSAIIDQTQGESEKIEAGDNYTNNT
uniref:Uncharacterized protein n=1 Tax=Strigamia maritima TaxID=126957 RepID=T1J3J3_STRMM